MNDITVVQTPVVVTVTENSFVIDVASVGVQGAAGVGIPVGGTIDQVLAKNSNDPYDTKWVSVGGTGTVTSVTASAPLTGGTITSSGTIGLDQTALSLNASTITAGTLPVLRGGTGVTTSTGTINNVLSASPTLTGIPTTPTAAIDTSTTQLASTAFVTNQASATTSPMDGTATVGTSKRYARQDHVHPSDTSRAPLASPTFTGTVTVPTPTNPTDAATKAYADSIASGLNIHGAVSAASTANIVGVYVGGTSGADGGFGVGATFTVTATGVFILDTNTITLNERVLLKNQTTQTQNGIYTCTTAGAVGVQAVFTRATDADNHIAGQVVPGDFVFVATGSQASTAWVQTTIGTSTNPVEGIKIGTDNITFTQFSAGTAYTAGTAINATSLATGTVAVSKVPVANGGTNLTTFGATAGVLKTDGADVLSASTIVNSDVSASAAIVDTKLAQITTASKVSTSAITGTLPVANGGTGATAVPTNGQIPIGNGTTYTPATLTGTTSQITVTNASGAITLSTPQNINTTSTVQFGALGISASPTISTGARLAATFNAVPTGYAPGLVGLFNFASGTITDGSASGATVPIAGGLTVGTPTFSSATARTITEAANVYIASAPVGAGAGPTTIGTAYSMYSAGPIRASSYSGSFAVQTGMRNILHNGDFNIWQRGTAQVYISTPLGFGTATPLSTDTYTADRWINNAATTGLGAVSLNGNQAGTNQVNGMKFYTIGSSGYSTVRQRIEASTAASLVGSQLTISGIFNQTTGTPTIDLYTTATGNTTDDLWTGTRVKVGSTITLAGSTATRQSGTFSVVVPAQGAYGLEIEITVHTSGQLSKIQLEQGAFATPFEVRPVGMELSLCQRFYERVTNTTGATATMFLTSSSSTAVNTLVPHITKRVLPALSFTGTWYGCGSGLGASANTVSAFNTFASSTQATRLQATVAGTTNGQASGLAAAAAAYYEISADL